MRLIQFMELARYKIASVILERTARNPTYLRPDYLGSSRCNLVRDAFKLIRLRQQHNIITHPVWMDFQGPLSICRPDFLFRRLNRQLKKFVWIDILLRGRHLAHAEVLQKQAERPTGSMAAGGESGDGRGRSW